MVPQAAGFALVWEPEVGIKAAFQMYACYNEMSQQRLGDGADVASVLYAATTVNKDYPCMLWQDIQMMRCSSFWL